MQEKRTSTAFQVLIEENMKLRDEICKLKKQLQYIEYLARGLVHHDLLRDLERSTK